MYNDNNTDLFFLRYNLLNDYYDGVTTSADITTQKLVGSSNH